MVEAKLGELDLAGVRGGPLKVDAADGHGAKRQHGRPAEGADDEAAGHLGLGRVDALDALEDGRQQADEMRQGAERQGSRLAARMQAAALRCACPRTRRPNHSVQLCPLWNALRTHPVGLLQHAILEGEGVAASRRRVLREGGHVAPARRSAGGPAALERRQRAAERAVLDSHELWASHSERARRSLGSARPRTRRAGADETLPTRCLTEQNRHIILQTNSA